MVFQANGKLLLTAEYVLMKGATALAIPSKLKQLLRISPNDGNYIHWKAYSPSGEWFSADYQIPDLTIQKTTDSGKAVFLADLIKHASRLNPEFSINGRGGLYTTEMQWQPEWGLGSSSSLIALIAQWIGCDAYQLHKSVSKGSGYDVFCALSETPLLFSLKNNLPQIHSSDFLPDFHEKLFLLYLDRKQNSAKAVEWFMSDVKVDSINIERITALTNSLTETQTIIEFLEVIKQHEVVMAEILGMLPVKKTLFSDFQGEVKSLGAWGGDFVLIASEMNEQYIKNYFNDKGYKTIFAWDQIVSIDR